MDCSENGSELDLKRLLNPAFYDHPVDRVELVETHISWIFLAGEFAYKLKKPVDFGFLDFSTLKKRQYYCLEELRLNRQFSPQLYLQVVSIGGDPPNPELNGLPVLDYAVKMKRFPQESQLDRMLEAGRLKPFHLEQFAVYIARAHRQLASAEATSSYGLPHTVMTPVLQNFEQIRSLITGRDMCHQLGQLERWSRTSYDRLTTLLGERNKNGFIRECHGDVHLGNMAWFDNEPMLFDCLEFNPNLRWIDTLNDIAFLIMDLDDRGEGALAWTFLNCYLRETGDYSGVPLLNFYKVYRALVRVKVACLRLSQPGLSKGERGLQKELLSSYLNLASSYTDDSQPLLIITHGFSGSGKTSFVTQLAPLCGAISLHSDLERKRIHNLTASERSQSPVAGGMYSARSREAVYSRLFDLAAILLEAGINVILDATFLKASSRSEACRLAREHQISLLILDFSLAEDELRRRLRFRANRPDTISEATEDVLNDQLIHHDPLNRSELKSVVNVHPLTKPEKIAERVLTKKMV